MITIKKIGFKGLTLGYKKKTKIFNVELNLEMTWRELWKLLPVLFKVVIRYYRVKKLIKKAKKLNLGGIING